MEFYEDHYDAFRRLYECPAWSSDEYEKVKNDQERNRILEYVFDNPHYSLRFLREELYKNQIERNKAIISILRDPVSCATCLDKIYNKLTSNEIKELFDCAIMDSKACKLLYKYYSDEQNNFEMNKKQRWKVIKKYYYFLIILKVNSIILLKMNK
jgi:hypothetical protein